MRGKIFSCLFLLLPTAEAPLILNFVSYFHYKKQACQSQRSAGLLFVVTKFLDRHFILKYVVLVPCSEITGYL